MLRKIFIKNPVLLEANMQEIPQFLAACGIFGELHKFLMNDQNILSPCAKNSLIPQILNAFTHQKYSEEKEAHIVDLVILSCNKGASTNMPVGYERYDCLQVAIRNNWKFIAQTLLARSKAPHYSHGIEYSVVEYAANFNMPLLLELFAESLELFSQDEILQFYASTARFAELGACLLGQDISLSEYTKSHIIFDIIIISLCNNSWRKPLVQMECEAIEIIRLAVAKGAYIDAHQNQYSKITPLMVAAERGIDSLFFSLIECGADLYARDSRKFYAFNYALGSGHEKLCMDIMDKYPNVLDYQDIPSLIQFTARLASYDLCKKIIEFNGNKLPLELKESIIFDIIYGVSTAALEEKATLLISDMHAIGAKINIQKADTGVTPLMCSVEKKFKNITKFLVEHHADLDAKNNEGCTVHSYASPEIMQWIIDNQALHLIGNQAKIEGLNDQILST
jgi:ankyrin repeat protein